MGSGARGPSGGCREAEPPCPPEARLSELRLAIRHQIAGFTLDIDVTAPAPAIVGVSGPSGAGKSLLLAAVAGLLPAERGEVWLDGEALHRLPVERRGIGLVFQDGRLFPHMSVARNLAYGLARSARPGLGLAEVVAMLGLEPLLARRPATLSGGERQRVALGRALLAHPRLLLMDEPLAALDTPRRREIMPALRRVTAAAGVPVLYVTHARDELVRLADWGVLMARGRVVASGAMELLLSQTDLAWTRDEDAAGLLIGCVAEHVIARGLSRLRCGASDVFVPLHDAPVGTAVRVVVPAREVILARAAPEAVSVNNVLACKIGEIAEVAPASAVVSLTLPGGRLLARVTQDAARRLALRAGDDIVALVKSVAVEVF